MTNELENAKLKLEAIQDSIKRYSAPTKKCECPDCKCNNCGSRKMTQRKVARQITNFDYKFVDVWTCSDCGAYHEEKVGEQKYEPKGIPPGTK